MGVPDDIRRWYNHHDMPVLTEDWYRRSETGESAGRQRERRAAVLPLDTSNMWWWEQQRFLWGARYEGEHIHIEALESFFAPYVEKLTPADQEAVRSLFNDRMTYQEQANRRGVTRQTVWESTHKAIARLTRLVGEDCPHPEFRNEPAWVRALCSLDHYWRTTFGTSFPNITREEPGE